MKNHKIVPCIFPPGETFVSLGCVDFAQLLFGIFDEDLEQNSHFYGVDCSFVSIARCKVLYKMILNKAPSRLEFSKSQVLSKMNDIQRYVVLHITEILV